MKVATWNVNSIKARLPNVLDWLDGFQPDVALLQETKTIDENFPRLEIEERGYKVLIHGQKSYNGVAILSKHPIEDPLIGLPGDDADEQARYAEGTINGIRFATIYLPNGNPVETEKFPYKLGWMKRLKARAGELLASETPVVLAGDYNVIPTDVDVHDPEAWASDALCQPESRAAFREILHLGYVDAYRVYNTAPHRYSFWDYQGGAWQNDHGVRIDHLLLSPQAADRLSASGIDSAPRGKPKASDHTPVWIELAA
ncbi:exodeoxyribonuclease III [Nisaea acidiphila]|uniref:Exodeoxyribonuclease III n=1 Tax=Nisaea acidiphila TaxID=1862145 RepID=A0A9J7AS92_9PROT|nr:exodeoxyribonuclease III [Nisaea acidiphila]UUX50086.1 exodeoxyribonuclease III [Nisaea acidiphila]